MTPDARPKLPMGVFPLGFALLVLTALAVSLLAPVLRCPEHDQERDLRDLNPCLGCNGHGRSTLFQRWNYLQYQQQCESITLFKL